MYRFADCKIIHHDSFQAQIFQLTIYKWIPNLQFTKEYLEQSGLLPYMERGHERSNSSKTLKIALGKNLSMEFKDNLDLNIIPKIHQFFMLGFFPAAI